MFTVRYDRHANILHWSMAGFWTVESVGNFARAMRDEVAKIATRPLRFDALCDSRDFPVQSPEVAHALSAILDAGRNMRSGRTAIVVGSMMNKLQASRSLVDPDLRVFLSMDEACAWLAEGRAGDGPE